MAQIFHIVQDLSLIHLLWVVVVSPGPSLWTWTICVLWHLCSHSAYIQSFWSCLSLVTSWLSLWNRIIFEMWWFIVCTLWDQVLPSKALLCSLTIFAVIQHKPVKFPYPSPSPLPSPFPSPIRKQCIDTPRISCLVFRAINLAIKKEKKFSQLEQSLRADYVPWQYLQPSSICLVWDSSNHLLLTNSSPLYNHSAINCQVDIHTLNQLLGV